MSGAPLALMFPGQGSQHVGMGRGLYGWDPVFTESVEEVFTALGPLGAQVRDDWLGEATWSVAVDDVRRAQPLIFAVDYALGRTVCQTVRPAAVIGHSAGELVAAVVAGIFSVADGARLMQQRVEAAVEVPSGGMLAVAAGPDELAPFLVGDVVVAAVNASRQVMLAGSTLPLRRVQTSLATAGYTFRPVPATSPFHSPAMQPAADAVRESFAATVRPATVPLYSAYTGSVLSATDAASGDFWARQLTDPVLFAPTLRLLLDDHPEGVRLIEAGSSQVLTALAKRTSAVRRGPATAVGLLPAVPAGPEADRSTFLAALDEMAAAA
ncbi:MAG TPA: acyltransferase domain-containing protein [Propionibacteriaceae bacterium]